jgi:predicted aspartyl protease
MIDTGAEASSIDRRIAEEINAQKLSKGTVHAMDGTFEAELVLVQVIFPEQNIVFSTPAAVLSFEDAGHTFDLILGRSFLQHCYLTMDGPNGRYALDWIE